MNNTTALSTTNGHAPARTFNDEEIALITATVAPGLSPKELQLFLYQCERTGLDPLARQIYGIKLGGKLTIQTSIDGLRLIANRSGEYAGQTAPQWCGEDGEWKAVWLPTAPPAACRLGVYRKGFARPLVKVVTFRESAVQQSPMWKKMPAHMLAKVCEAAALRAAFPQELSGLYSQDEMGSDRHDAIDADVIDEPKRIDPPKEAAPEKKERVFQPPAELKIALMDKGDRLQKRIESGAFVPGKNDSRPNGRTPEESRTAALASLRGLGSDTLGIDDNRHAFLRFIFECDSSKLLTQGENEALIRWVGATREVDSEGNGVWAPHPIAIQEARAVLAAIREAVKEETLGDVAATTTTQS